MCDHDDTYYGDPRRCPAHPWVATSSPDGLHDTPCGRCEYEMEMEASELEVAPPVLVVEDDDNDLPF